MDTSSPAAFVNGALLRRYIGQKVRAVVQVIRSDIGSVTGKSTDDQQIVVKGSPPPSLTTYLEVIGIAESENTIRADVWTNFGDNFGNKKKKKKKDPSFKLEYTISLLGYLIGESLIWFADAGNYNELCKLANGEFRHMFI